MSLPSYDQVMDFLPFCWGDELLFKADTEWGAGLVPQ